MCLLVVLRGYSRAMGEKQNSLKAEHQVVVSLRQAPEWGMRALQGTICCQKSR